MRNLFFISLVILAGCQQLQLNKPEAEKPVVQYDGRKAEIKKLADTAREKGDLNTAAQIEAQLIALDDKDSNSIIALSKTLRKMQKYNESKLLLEDSIKKNPTDDLLIIDLAKTLLYMGDADASIGRLSLVKTHKDRDFYNTQGVAYENISKHKEAQEAFKAGLALNPNDDLLQNNLALSYIIDKRYDDGIKILESLANGPKSSPKYRQNLALAYGAKANPEKAMELLLKDMSRKEAEENLQFYKNMNKK
jgi:Flp pilus assembly protein TadD